MGDVCRKYDGKLYLHYYGKPNSGPGQSRNYGAERANGEYLIVLDSDVVLPRTYLEAVDNELRREEADAFGGPDAAHDSFTPVQKAISYSMTSFFTTGGIRGGKKYEEHFSDTDRHRFEQYISAQIDKINIAGKDNDFLRERMLTMYANPLFNKEKALSHE